MSINNNQKLYTYKKYYINIFLVITIFISLSKYLSFTSFGVSVTYDFLSLLGMLFTLFYGVNLLVVDKKLNKELSVLSSPYFKGSLILLIYLFILSLFHRTAFEGYNNAFFVIHSLIFFYVLLIYGDKYKWIRNIARVAEAFIYFVSVISLSNIIIYIFSKIGLFTTLQNENLKIFLMNIAPENGNFIGLFNDNGLFIYLMGSIIFLYFFSIIYHKKSNLKYIFVFLFVINCTNIFLYKNEALCFIVIFSIILFFIYYIIISIRSNHKIDIFSKSFIILFISLLMLLILYIIFSNSTLASEMRVLFIDVFSLKWINIENSKLSVYKQIVKVDESIFYFGANDSHIYAILVQEFPNLADLYLNNNITFFNMYLDFLVRYGMIASLLLIFLVVLTFVNIIRKLFVASFRRKRFLLCFVFQTIIILFIGFFCQYPLFKQNLHSLVFVYCFASLIGLNYFEERDFSARL